MNCLHCNKPIEGKRNTKKYCGNTCKQYAYLSRNFAMPSNLNAIPLNNSEINLTALKNEINSSASNIVNGNIGGDSNSSQIKSNINLNPTQNHGNKNQITEQEYQYINPDILDRIQHGYISQNITSSYFTNNSNRGGRMNTANFPAFAYVLPRIRCIFENLFQLSYKSKIYYRTAITVCKAIEEILASEYIKLLPSDFPFIGDLIKLHEQFYPMAVYLVNDKDGIKFKLTKAAIVRYIMILSLIRDCVKKEPFTKLFPELCKPVIHKRPHTTKG